MTQSLTKENKLKEIDSLIQYTQFDIAEKKCDSILSKIDNKFNSSNLEYALELKYRKGVILDRRERHVPEQLQLFLEIIDQAKSEELHSLTFRIYLMISLSYEKAKNYELTNKYLELANQTYKKYNLEVLYSTYCVRKSSYLRLIKEYDLALFYAKKANVYANLYLNQTDIVDSYILLGSLYGRMGNQEEAIKCYNVLLKKFEKNNDKPSISVSYMNIARTYNKMNKDSLALVYLDSAKIYFPQLSIEYQTSYYRNKYETFANLNVKDSVLYYQKLYYENKLIESEKFEKLKTRELEERYQNSKNLEKLRAKNLQLLYVLGFLILIVITTLLIFRKNNKIKYQNKIINRQLIEMAKLLDQKKVLLSELQHRVKNNLQHVISILEIQKESADFNNIEELLRGNQNRIHSMALLHKKLNIVENVNEVDLHKYITELAELVKESYDTRHRKISLDVKSDVEILSIDKVFPLGLIIVELVSNSMKHAFGNNKIGVISIQITRFESHMRLVYFDNGIGYDFNCRSDKGLGLEIVRGLIDQLDGVVTTSNELGFELTIDFS